MSSHDPNSYVLYVETGSCNAHHFFTTQIIKSESIKRQVLIGGAQISDSAEELLRGSSRRTQLGSEATSWIRSVCILTLP